MVWLIRFHDNFDYKSWRVPLFTANKLLFIEDQTYTRLYYIKANKIHFRFMHNFKVILKENGMIEIERHISVKNPNGYRTSPRKKSELLNYLYLRFPMITSMLFGTKWKLKLCKIIRNERTCIYYTNELHKLFKHFIFAQLLDENTNVFNPRDIYLYSY